MAGKGKVEIEILAKDKASPQMQKIGKSADNMGAKFNKVKLAVVGMGIAMAVALTKMVTGYAKAGDEIAKMAKRTGFGTVALSELRHVAKLCGADLSDIEKATKRMSRTIIDAGRGLETYIRSFQALGLNVEELRAMKPEEQFWAICNALADLDDQTLKVAVAQEIFGRAGTNLIPMLDAGSIAIADMRQETHDLHQVWDEESATKSEAFCDSVNNMKEALTGFGNEIAEVLMPKITALFQWLTEKLKPALAWLDEHPEAINAFLIFAGVIAGAVVIGAIAKLTMMLWGLVTVLGAVIAGEIAALAFAGPYGWAALAAGIGAVALSLAAIDRMLGLGLLARLPGAEMLKTLPWVGEYFKAPSKARVRVGEEWIPREEYIAGKEAEAREKEEAAREKEEAARQREAIRTEEDIKESIERLDEKISDLTKQIEEVGGIEAEALGIRKSGLEYERRKEVEALAKAMPSMQRGGIVPGPRGMPIPILAHGGEPFGGMARGFGTQINIYAEAFMGREEDARAFARMILERIRVDNRRTIGRWA